MKETNTKSKHIVRFSGGKESTAMLLRMIELDMQIDDITFCDNGLEYPEIYEYIKKVEKYIDRKITVIKPKKTWDELFYTKVKKGRFKGRIRGFPYVVLPGCWASRDLKVRPMEKLNNKTDLYYLGINFNEKKRVQYEKGHCENLRYPLIDWKWTEHHCLKYLRDKKLENPVYKKFKRTGCWLCPKQSIIALRILYNDYPDLWKKLRHYEIDSPHGFSPNKDLYQLECRFKNESKSLENSEFYQKSLIELGVKA